MAAPCLKRVPLLRTYIVQLHPFGQETACEIVEELALRRGNHVTEPGRRVLQHLAEMHDHSWQHEGSIITPVRCVPSVFHQYLIDKMDLVVEGQSSPQVPIAATDPLVPSLDRSIALNRATTEAVDMANRLRADPRVKVIETAALTI